MTIAREILAILRGTGINVQTDGDSMLLHPTRLMTDPLRALVREHRADLLALLKAEPPQSCLTCRHTTSYRACSAPAAAGIESGFAIKWATPEHAAKCQAWAAAIHATQPAGSAQ